MLLESIPAVGAVRALCALKVPHLVVLRLDVILQVTGSLGSVGTVGALVGSSRDFCRQWVRHRDAGKLLQVGERCNWDGRRRGTLPDDLG